MHGDLCVFCMAPWSPGLHPKQTGAAVSFPLHANELSCSGSSEAGQVEGLSCGLCATPKTLGMAPPKGQGEAPP